jgi:site-specific DNA-methyltransferase (adenine-specific)
VTPYYSDDLVTIYHGDCREEWVDRIAVCDSDALITDPPYGIAATTANYSRGRSQMAVAHDWPAVVGDDEPFDPTTLLALGLPAVLWGANYYANRLPPSPSWLVWNKRIAGVRNDSADCELAWTNLTGPARVFHHEWMGMLRSSERGESYHPTQKPVALMRWCVERTDGTVLDPYMGSGSTLVAAKSLGRHAIGIEIEERYCEIAALRCSQEILGLSA